MLVLMNSAANNASPAKLRSGAWGARVKGTVSEGDTVTITTRAGKSWDARVTKVVWSGDGVSICATESIDRPASRTSYVGGNGCHRCRRTATRTAQIWEECEYCGTEPVYM
jgi:hypothetical protein